MKKIIIYGLFIILFSSFILAQIKCEIKEDACKFGDLDIFQISGIKNSHVTLNKPMNELDYYRVCCFDNESTINNKCEGNYDIIAKISSKSNAHIQKKDYVKTIYPTNLCLSTNNNLLLVNCDYATDCSLLGLKYTCLASISGDSNAMIGNCLAYPTKMCCSISEDKDGDGKDINNDCDDNDPKRYFGNQEICDYIDNDCDEIVDEGFFINTSCSLGIGICENVGTIQCDFNGLSFCNATPIESNIEFCEDINSSCNGCDGIDDDCDGIKDNGCDCDNDLDNDGIKNMEDKDIDGDGSNNWNDGDDDNDGINDEKDVDDDNDCILDFKDLDVDNEGLPFDNDLDNDGITNGNDLDDDGDGIHDNMDLDDDNDGIPDELDTDDDNDGIPDELDTDEEHKCYNCDSCGEGFLSFCTQEICDDCGALNSGCIYQPGNALLFKPSDCLNCDTSSCQDYKSKTICDDDNCGFNNCDWTTNNKCCVYYGSLTTVDCDGTLPEPCVGEAEYVSTDDKYICKDETLTKCDSNNECSSYDISGTEYFCYNNSWTSINDLMSLSKFDYMCIDNKKVSCKEETVCNQNYLLNKIYFCDYNNWVSYNYCKNNDLCNNQMFFVNELNFYCFFGTGKTCVFGDGCEEDCKDDLDCFLDEEIIINETLSNEKIENILNELMGKIYTTKLTLKSRIIKEMNYQLELLDNTGVNPNNNRAACELIKGDIQEYCDKSGKNYCWANIGPNNQQCCGFNNETWLVDKNIACIDGEFSTDPDFNPKHCKLLDSNNLTQTECENNNDTFCFAPEDMKIILFDNNYCCGDDLGETWRLFSKTSLSQVLVNANCIDGKWKTIKENKMSYDIIAVEK